VMGAVAKKAGWFPQYENERGSPVLQALAVRRGALEPKNRGKSQRTASSPHEWAERKAHRERGWPLEPGQDPVRQKSPDPMLGPREQSSSSRTAAGQNCAFYFFLHPPTTNAGKQKFRWPPNTLAGIFDLFKQTGSMKGTTTNSR